MNARMKQQGGLAGSFVIIGIVLALLLLGGVYFLKSNEINDKLASDTDSSTSQDEANQNQKDQNTQSEDQAKTDDSVKTQDQDQEDTDKKATDSAPESREAAESNDAHAELPQTGPADTAATLAVFAVLTYSIVMYIRSRGRLTL